MMRKEVNVSIDERYLDLINIIIQTNRFNTVGDFINHAVIRECDRIGWKIAIFVLRGINKAIINDEDIGEQLKVLDNLSEEDVEKWLFDE